jgi:hypothetical protein
MTSIESGAIILRVRLDRPDKRRFPSIKVTGIRKRIVGIDFG